MGIYRDMKKRLYIRADGNGDIGLGHIMRSMTIANVFKEHGYECTFLSSLPINKELFLRFGFDYIEVDFPYDNKSITEAEWIVKKIYDHGKYFFLVDSYFASNEYLSILKKNFTLVCINSTKNLLITDFLINENIACDKDYFNKLYSGRNTKLLLGAEYSLIRKEFLNKEYSVKKKVMNVLVTTGGGDQHNFMTMFLKNVKKHNVFEDVSFTFVSGSCNYHYEDLILVAKEFDNVKVVVNSSNMAKLMQDSDLAITAGGTTVLELSVIGVPTIGVALGDDQEAGLMYMGGNGMIRYVGKPSDREFWKTIMSALEELIKNELCRKKISNKSKEIIDGDGANRVFSEITGEEYE